MPTSNDAPEDEGQVSTKALSAGVSGAAGAVMTTVLFYPIELVKNRLQAQVRGTGFAYDGLAHGLVSVVKDEGLSALYTGVGPTVSRALTSDFATIFFGELFIGRYARALGCPSSSAPGLPLRILGACTSVALTLPLETISTRVTTSRPSLSFFGASRILWQEGGFRAFWRGMNVMLILCVNPALTFTSFDWLKRLLFFVRSGVHQSQTGGDKSDQKRLSFWESFLVGAAAKLLTLSIVYPLIRGKFLLQARDTGDTGIFGVLRQVARQEGLRSWYVGLDAQLSKSLLSTALMLSVKEGLEAQCQRLVTGRSC